MRTAWKKRAAMLSFDVIALNGKIGELNAQIAERDAIIAANDVSYANVCEQLEESGQLCARLQLAFDDLRKAYDELARQNKGLMQEVADWKTKNDFQLIGRAKVEFDQLKVAHGQLVKENMNLYGEVADWRKRYENIPQVYRNNTQW